MFNNLNCNSDKLPQPKSITISLKEHQKTAFTAMSTIEEKGFINHKDLIVETNLGILADIPGSGKSMMVISLISNKKSPESNEDKLPWNFKSYSSISSHEEFSFFF